MFRDLKTLLAYEIKRRPALAGIYANLDEITAAELERIPLPVAWMRTALLQVKADRALRAAAAEIGTLTVDGQVPDPLGTVRRWIGNDAFVRVGRSELLVTVGTLIWLDRSGVWIDTIHTTHIDPKLAQQTVFHARMTRSAYAAAIRRGQLDANPAAPALTAERPFRIFRPPNG